MRVGFVGLNPKGASIARAMALGGLRLHVLAEDPEAGGTAIPLLDGVPHVACTDLAELGRACEVVGTCIDDGLTEVARLDDVVATLVSAMPEGSVIANHETGSVELALRLAAQGRQAGIHVLDAPVSGPPAGLLRLAGGRPSHVQADPDRYAVTFVGGADAGYVRSRRVLGSVARSVHHIGPPGAGELVKLLNNMVFLANLKTAGDALALGHELGVPAARLVELLEGGSGASFALGALRDGWDPARLRRSETVFHKQLRDFAAALRTHGVTASTLTVAAGEGVDGLAGTMALVHGRCGRGETNGEGGHDDR